MEKVQFQFKSKLGWIYLVASAEGLVGVHFEKQPEPVVKALKTENPAHQILKTTQVQLEQYFSGQRTEFDVPLVFEGTKFQQSVWRQLTRIPYGNTISYKELAHRVKSPKAFRAVGSANGKNPFCIIVPCHRVVAADGSLGGYAYGPETKTRLLNLEKTTAQV